MGINNIALTAGMQANLFNLQHTSKLMEQTQLRLSTGKRVNSALDDPLNYFAALGHTNRAADLTLRKDEMGEAVQTIKAADKGIESITDLINQAKTLAQSALSATTSTAAANYVTQFNEIRQQINSMAVDSGYKGNNLLTDDTTSAELSVKFNEDGTAALDIAGFDARVVDSGTASDIAIGYVTTAQWVSGDGTDFTIQSTGIEADIDELDTAINTLRSESSELATNLGIITARQEFTDGMIQTLREGANNLTNADMNEEGANMLMLQTRQALGTTALSMASQAAQSVLRLF
jgi:flagellin-like hook-associated protein FlgL